MLQKPTHIYSTKFYVIVAYSGYSKKPDNWTIPTPWHNFHSLDQPDIDDDYIKRVVKDLWVDFIEGSSQTIWKGTAYLYAIECEEDWASELEYILENIHNTDGTILKHEEISNLIKGLLNSVEIELPKEQYYKNGQRVKFQVDSWLDWDENDVVELLDIDPDATKIKAATKNFTLDDLKLRNGQIVTIESLETASELGVPGYEYYNIRFEDGITLSAMSGMCLSKIKL